MEPRLYAGVHLPQ